MSHLYSCRHDGDIYRITKLTHDLDVESSYLVSASACECPGFERRSHCRHTEMLPLFIARDACDGRRLLDFERNVWVQGFAEEPETHSVIDDLPSTHSAHSGHVVGRLRSLRRF